MVPKLWHGHKYQGIAPGLVGDFNFGFSLGNRKNPYLGGLESHYRLDEQQERFIGGEFRWLEIKD
jgi:hypothetical protein